MDNQIAVLLPHYNNYEGLRLTLNSLLNETEVFTLFVFDDGSDNINTVETIIKEFNNQIDIILIENESNIGITKTLNKGLKHIKSLNAYTFIARLDAGDICLNDRFKKQKSFFLKNTDISLVGSWVKYVNMERKLIFKFKPPSHHNKLKKIIHFYNPFVHPSVMFKINIIDKIGFYPENYPALEDHAYFFKVIKTFKVGMLQDFLLEYELNPNGISLSNRKNQAFSRIKLLLHQYKFDFYSTIGLLKSFFTYLLPHNLLILLKKNIFYK